MAPRTLQMITCFNIAVHVPLPAKEANALGSTKKKLPAEGVIALGSAKKKLPAEEAIALGSAKKKLPAEEAIALGSAKKKLPAEEAIVALGSAKKRPWTREIKRKILASVRRERIMPAREEQEPRGVDVEKSQTTKTQRARPPLKKRGIIKGPRDDGSPEAIIAIGKRMKGLRVRFDLPEGEIAAAPVKPPPFPKGVLGEPPESFRHSGPEMTAAFLASVVAAGDADSATSVDHDELVSRRKERMEACSRRLSYLRDYCPFRREDDDEEDEESTPETAAAAEPDHTEEALPPVKTGLPFDSPESEAEFVKAIGSSYLLKDDSVSLPPCVRKESRPVFV